jgi:rod shape-determining protein MreC
MLHWLSERKSPILFVFLLTALLAVTSYHSRGERGQSALEQALFWAGTPVLKTVDACAAGVRGLRERFVTLQRLREENRRLREELSRVRNVDPLREEYRLENDRLRRLLGLQESVDWPSVGARVTRLDAAEMFRTAGLTIPPEAGVEEGMPAVSPQGVVGRILRVAGSKATLRLVTDPSSGIAVVTSRGRVQGIVSGAGGGLLKMDYVVRGSDIATNDLVLTSGLDGIFPKGIPVGTVDAVEQGQGLVQKVLVKPAVQFDHLEEILILLKPPDEYPLEDHGGLP